MSKKKKKKTIGERILDIFIVIFALTFIGSGAYLANYYYTNHKTEKEFEEIKGLVVDDGENYELVEDENGQLVQVPAFVNVDGKMILRKFQNLYMRNKHFVGWIKIDGTKIDYPVVQCMEDEEYYLRRNFIGESSTAGTVFIDTAGLLDPRSDNLLIYGHNMKAGTMFHDLLQYEEEDFYKNHKYITFDTIYEEATYEVIAAFRSNIKHVDDPSFKYYQFFDAVTEDDFNYFVDSCKELTAYDIDATAEFGDELITLSTCSYHVTNGRFAVVARKIK